MSLQITDSGKILYKGREVGEHRFENGKSTVTLNISYDTEWDEWWTPLSLFAIGLGELPENRPTAADLSLETPEDGTTEELPSTRFLIERIVRQGSYIWKFHKTDVDNWPSQLHGHDYDKALKFDAITGQIYDAVTRQHCRSLKPKHLKDIQANLRASKDFAEKVAQLIDK